MRETKNQESLCLRNIKTWTYSDASRNAIIEKKILRAQRG